jgi:hypothetical protein
MVMLRGLWTPLLKAFVCTKLILLSRERLNCFVKTSLNLIKLKEVIY